MKVNSKFVENVAKLKYLRIAVTNGNYKCEDIKSRLNFGNSCYLLNGIFCHVVRTGIRNSLTLPVIYICGCLPCLDH